MSNLLYSVMAAHLIGDFYLQPAAIAEGKKRNLWLLLPHWLLYALPFAVLYLLSNQNPQLPTLLTIAIGVWKRDRIFAWLADLPLMRAAIVAAAAGSLVGALSNDSGALFIQVGTLYLALVLGFVWTTTGRTRR